MNKKRLIITSLISIFLVTILMLGSTYSIFTTTDTDEELNVYKTGILDITYTLSDDNITFMNHMSTTIEDSIWITPYRITVNNNGTASYMFDVILEDVTATEVIDSRYIMVQVGKLEPKRLSECEKIDSKYVIKEDVILVSNNSVNIDIRVWIAEDVKNTEITKSFNAKLVVDGLAVYNENTEIDNTVLEANIPVNMSEHIVGLYNDGSELTNVNIGGDSSNPSVTQNSKQGLMLDNNGEYRYYGSNPDNYVEFNNELWRIISVSNVKDNEEDTEGSMRVKIIRDESIGNYSWDSSDSSINNGTGVNEWSKSDLMTELNTLYYNKQLGTCYNGQNNTSISCDFTNIGLSNESKNLIDDALWYLGGHLGIESLYVDSIYNEERGTNVYNCSINDGACPRNTSWVGKIGLMYASDYAYAADLNVCKSYTYHEDSSKDYRNSNCKSTDWLYNDLIHQWTLFSRSTLSSYEIYIDMDGCIGSLTNSYAFSVRPSMYLRDDVIIVGGTGTELDPYQIKVKDDFLSNHIIDLYNDGSNLKTVNIGGDSNKPIVTQNTKQSIMLDNNGEYRYYGKNPNNYVEFNDELWRIISVSNVKSSESDLIGSTRVKIIRDESIGEYSWDSSASTINSGWGVNDWTQADLMKLLNITYYNGSSGTCYNGDNNISVACNFGSVTLNSNAKNLIGTALWYLGQNPNGTGGVYANDYYSYERGTMVYDCSVNDGACPRATLWGGTVALMYASDYIYATDQSLCLNDGYYYSENANCANNNWIHQNIYQWTLSVRSTYAFRVFVATNTNDSLGSMYTNTASYPFEVRPVVHLKSDVIIKNGTGTKTDPYQISIY